MRGVTVEEVSVKAASVKDGSIEGGPSGAPRSGSVARGGSSAGGPRAVFTASRVSAALLSAAAVALAGCSGDVTPFEEAIEVRDLELERLAIVPPLGARTDPLFMSPGDSVPLTLLGGSREREFELEGDGRNWRVSDGRYATIDGNGRLVALADGAFSVEVNVGDVVAQGFDVEVSDAAIESLFIERAERKDVPAELDRCIAAPYLAIGRFNDNGSERLLLSDVEWDVVQGSGARIETLPDASAELIGTMPGEVMIVAESGGASGELTATVGDTLQSLEIDSTEAGTLSRSVGGTLQLRAIGKYGPNADVTRDVDVTDSVVWDVTSGQAFATVTNGAAGEGTRGLITAASAGEAQVRARCGEDRVATASFTTSASGTSDSDGASNTLSFEEAVGAGDDSRDGGTIEIFLSQRVGDGALQLRVSEGSTYDRSDDVTLEANWQLIRSDVDIGVDDPQLPGIPTTTGQSVGQLDTTGLDRGQFLPLRPGTAVIRATFGDDSADLTVRVLP